MNKEQFEALKRIMNHTVNGGMNDKAFWDDVKTIERYMEEYPNMLYSAWHIDDVKRMEGYEDLTDDEAREVLRRAQDNHDATIGINWDVLEVYADEVKSERVAK